jgi:hypothetical protein
MQEVDDSVPPFIGHEEIVFRGLGALQASKCGGDHGDTPIGEYPIVLLNSRVFLSPQKIV